jgi:hypothetical protein
MVSVQIENIDWLCTLTMNSKLIDCENSQDRKGSTTPKLVTNQQGFSVHFIMLQKPSAARLISQLGALHLFERRKDPKRSR